MNDTELRALEYLRRREWNQAIALFDQLLEPVKSYETQNEKVVELLFGRSECFSELGRYEAVVNDCQKIIKLISLNGGVSKYGSKAHRRLVLALFALQRFPEAEAAAKDWISVGGDRTRSQAEAEVLLNRVRLALRDFSVTSCYSKNMSAQHKLEEELLDVDSRLESWMGVGLPESRLRRNRRHPVELINEIQDADNQVNDREQTSSIAKQFGDGRENLGETKLPEGLNQMTKADLKAANMATSESQPSCSYCALSFINQLELHAHCQTESHQMVIMSDEGRDWRWRPPPRGVTSDTYTLCESWADGDGVTGGPCRYGNQCVEAHNPEELTEWRERFEYRRMKLQKACDKELYGKSYTEQLLERWMQSATPNSVMKEHLDGVSDSCSNDLVTSVVSKTSTKEWVITLKTPQILCAVALLQDAHRSHFMLKGVSSSNPNTGVALEWIPNNHQEWLLPPNSSIKVDPTGSTVFEHRVTVSFATAIYGTFRQSVVFDLGSEPVMVKHLCVDVVPVSDADKIKEIKKELFVSTERWDEGNAVIVPFSHAVAPSTGNSYSPVTDGSKEQELLSAYPSPNTSTFALTQSTMTERKLTKNNYRARMHELLAVEEMARYQQVAQYNLTTRLRLANCYLLSASGMATSTTKYAHNGELFALMTLGKTISEDTLAGRLILNNCTTVLIAEGKNSKGKRKDDGSPDSNNGDLSDSATDEEGPEQKRVVYEALIEDKGKKVIYLRLSAAATKALNLKADTGFNAEVQFQLNRLQYCEWHYAIDRIPDYKIVFPDTYLEPNIPWSPKRQWSEILDSRLNLKQKEAVVAITTPISTPLPPILIIGPFGTGKTYTLAQAIKQVVQQPGTRVLVCTHSNSAGDLYIRDYLHPHVEAGHEEARPLRIYYHKRWVATVNEVVQKYCLIDVVGGMKQFKIPSLEDIEKHRVVVVTLSISMCLASLGLKKDHFTHILLDEAAQAMECEAIMPLALASTRTRIVLAGDHMQLSPELFSSFARERNLHVSLLERLYDHYPASFPCKILLCENYRAHQAIIKFTSELFYDQKLISSGKQPRHEKYYPLTFFTTRGEDVQDTNSTAFYNNSEVYEVVERVSELKKKWPAAWGKIDDQSIGIVTPYADQVFRIRSELRKRRMGGISVERVLNVQGKQFRAIFLSTVRTRKTCSSTTKSVSSSSEDMDYGFLSNSKLLNTAITRAQSLVAVVGDPVALCSIGRCRKVWERFIEICNENDSLYGIMWSSLRAQLDGVELKKTYTLNPLAKEFVPRRLQQQLTEFRALSVLMQPPQPGNCPYLFFPLLLCPPGVPGVPQQALPGPGRNQAQGGVNPPFPINGPQVHHVNGALPNSTPHPASPTVIHQQWRMMPPPGNLPVGNIPNAAVTLTGNDSVMASGPPGVTSQSVAGSLNQIGQSGPTVNAAGRITPVNWKNQQPTSGPPGDLLGLSRPPPGLILPNRSINATMSQNVPVANIQSGTYQNSSILNNLTGNIAGNTLLPSNIINTNISSKNIVSSSPGGNIANLNLNHRNIPSPNVIQAGNMSVINSTTLNPGGGVLPANLLGGNLMNGGLMNTKRIPSNGNLVPSSTSFGLNVGAGIAVGSPSPASPAGNNLSQNEGLLSFGRGGPVSFVPSTFPLGEPVTVHPPPRKESQPVQLLLERQGPALPLDWQVLLPPNVGLVDIAESRSQQQEWYSHLTALGEVSLAKRFLDLMWLCRNNPIAAASAANLNLAQRHQRQLSPSVNQAGDFTQPPPDTIRSINDLLNDRNSAQAPSVQSIQQQQHHLVSNGLPVVLPFSNQQNKIHALHNGHLPPQIWAGPVGSSPDNKQALLVRDMTTVIQGGALVNSNNGIAPPLQSIGPLSSPAFRTNHSLDIPVGDVLGQSNWSAIPPQQQSVPLYRRQPTLNQDHQQQLSQQQSLSQQQHSLSQHHQSLSQHPQPLSQHPQSVSQHQQSVIQHQQSIGQHQQSLGQHQQSLGQHQQSLNQHQQSMGQHQQSLGQHQQSLGQHQQSLSQHQLSQQQQLNQQLAQQQHQQQIAQQHQLLKQQQIAQHQFSQQQHIQQLQLQRQQQQQNNRTQESPVSTSSLGHLLDGLNIDKGNMNSGYPAFVRGQLPSRELGHQYQTVQQVPPPPPPVQSSMRTTNGNDDSGDELISSINRQTTYASVLRSQQKPPPVSTASTNGVEKTSDPFTLVSNLSRKRNQCSSPGFYQYFH